MLLFLTNKKVNSDTFIKDCVREYLNFYSIHNEAFQIIRNALEKPYIQPELIKFSLSHSGEYTIIAISQKDVGIDIQKHTPCKTREISQRFFDINEKTLKNSSFFDLWAAKEAYLKHKGIDLINGLRTFIKDKDIILLNLIPTYSIAISSQDKDILIVMK